MRVCTGDLEADGLLDKATRVWCGVFKEEATQKVVKFRPHQIPEMLEYMDTIDVLKMHNGIGYDWPLLKKLYGYEYKGKKVDTLVMSRLLNTKRIVPYHCPNKKIGPHSVEAWGYRVGRGKPDHEDWSQFSEEMLHRCSEDVEIQELIYKALLEEARGGNWRNAFLMSFELFENLQKQEEYGWLVDKQHMEQCIHQLTRWIERIDRVIYPNLPNILEIEETKKEGEYNYIKKPFLKSGKYSESVCKWISNCDFGLDNSPVVGCFSRISFRKVDLNSGAETKYYLLSQGWEPKEWNLDDEGKRTSPKLNKDDPFEGLESKIGRVVAKRVQCRQRRGIVEGLCEIIRSDGRIPSVVNTLAATGRATHRNIVNIPQAKSFYGKQMRQIFTSAKKKTLVGTDSDGCQIRMLCGRMNDPQYTAAVLNGNKDDGTDIHSVNMRAADLSNRDDAKTFFYGILFGAGDAKTGKIVKGDAARGRALKDKFFAGLPALKDLVDRLVAEWSKTARQKYNGKYNRMEKFDGYITGLDGRPILVPSEHMVLVYLLQSDEAIMMTAAYNKANLELAKKYEYGKQYGFVCWYHDEYTVECDVDIAEDVKRICEESIVWAGEFFKISCPHAGHGKIGENWYDIH